MRDATALRAFPIRPRGHREAIARGARATRIASSPRRAGRTRSRPPGLDGRAVRRRPLRHAAGRLARRSACRCRPPQAFAPIRRIGGRPAGTSATRSGGCAASSTCSSAASGSAAAGATPSSSTRRRRPSTSGASRPTSRTSSCACAPRCGCPAGPGCSSRSTATTGGSTIRQTAIFDPVGLPGAAYWYGLFPLHSWMFAGMLRRIARPQQPPPRHRRHFRRRGQLYASLQRRRNARASDALGRSREAGSLSSPSQQIQ